MSTYPQQTKQPVPLFYGEVDGSGATQDLQSGFDYVITSIILSDNSSGGGSYVILEDESSVRIAILPAPGAVTGTIVPFIFAGEMPIGPRTQLKISTDGTLINVYIGGYALNPVTALSV
jgi:hypothetical protein